MSYSLEDREDQKHSCYTAGELLERYSEDGKMSYSSLCTPLRSTLVALILNATKIHEHLEIRNLGYNYTLFFCLFVKNDM